MNFAFWQSWGINNPKMHLATDEPMLDLSARLKVSHPHSIFHGNLTLGKSPYIWDEVLGGSATSVVVAVEAAVDMAVSQSGDYAIRQTLERYNYQAGKPQEVWISNRMAWATGVTFRQGCFSSGYVAPYAPDDGLYFMTKDQAAYCCICKGGVERAVPQSEWNLDKLDGTGPSGLVIDFTKPQLMSIGFEWLGVGPVRFGFQLNGVQVFCHNFFTANISSSIYMRNCTQPVRMELRSTGGAATCRCQCSAVIQDGGESNFGIVGAADTDGIAVSVAVGVTRPILTARINPASPNHQVRMVSSYLFNSAVNTSFQWMLLWRPTFAGALTWVTIPDSAIQVAYGYTNPTTLTGAGLIMEAGYGDTKSSAAITESSQTTLSVGTKIDGTSDTVSLVVKSLAGTCNIYGGLQARQYL